MFHAPVKVRKFWIKHPFQELQAMDSGHGASGRGSPGGRLGKRLLAPVGRELFAYRIFLSR
jgi:hypothetical protein